MRHFLHRNIEKEEGHKLYLRFDQIEDIMEGDA